MDKLEKCYYAVIGNKKRGKFSGAGPIQVAKKVASKKLKAGKEMEFYLDEVADKKRFGPYQARKDKKSGKVVVVKGRKMMKGGLLSADNERLLKTIFTNFNNNGIGFPTNPLLSECINERLPLIPFGREPIIYCFPRKINGVTTNKNLFYRIAIFKERNGNIYIMIYKHSLNFQSFIEIVNLNDFFLNPKYLDLFTVCEFDKKEILLFLNDSMIESRTISERIKKIYTLLYIPAENDLTQRVLIYLPKYDYPQIMKCVYSDLTFGILDEEMRASIPVNNNLFIKPTSFFQKFLILKKTGLSGMSINEPIIYVRDPFVNENRNINRIREIKRESEAEIKRLQQKLISKNIELATGIISKNPDINSKIRNIVSLERNLALKTRIISENTDIFRNSKIKYIFSLERNLAQNIALLKFDYCIYYSSNRNKLIIRGDKCDTEFTINNDKLQVLNPIIFNILSTIPNEFGGFSRIIEVSESMIKYHNTRRKLPSQLNSILRNIPINSKQNQLEKQINQLKQIIESLKLLEPKEPEAQLNKAYRKLTIFPELKTQLNKIQSLIQKLQPEQTFKQPQQTLEQQLTQLQQVLTDKLIEQQT